jgi:MFS family permease
VWTQVLSALQSGALAALAFTGRINVAWILGLQVVQGMINAFDTPARQAFVVQMVEDRADLPNAIALNSTMVNGGRIIGPSIGGVLIAAFGEGWCFLIDAISYLFVIGSLLAMRVEHKNPERKKTTAVEELREGFDYLRRFAPMWTTLLLLAIVATMGVPYTVLMPAIAATVLHGGPHTLGFLMTASGLGALVGALYLASRSSVVGLGRVITISTMVFGAALVAFSFLHTLWASLLVLPFVGAGMMIEMASTNTFLQTIVEEKFRGRVMAFYAMSFLGTAPIGSLIAGVLADRIGAQRTITFGGLACIAGGAWFWRRLPRWRAAIRPLYIQRGILPDASITEPATVSPASRD